MMFSRTRRYAFRKGSRQFLLAHASQVVGGRLVSAGEPLSYRAVEPREAEMVLRGMLHAPPHMLYMLAVLLHDSLVPPGVTRDPRALVEKVCRAVSSPLAILVLFAWEEHFGAPIGTNPPVPLADLQPEAPPDEHLRTNATLALAILRKDTLEGIEGVQACLFPESGTVLRKKKSTPNGLADFGAWPPGRYALDVQLQGLQAELFLPPERIEVQLGRGENKRVELILEPDTAFEVILHDLNHHAIPAAPYQVFTGDLELCAGDADDAGIARFDLPSPSTERLTIAWSAPDCPSEASFIQEFFVDTERAHEALDEARLRNLGYPSQQDFDAAADAFCRAYDVDRHEVSNTLEEIFHSKVPHP